MTPIKITETTEDKYPLDDDVHFRAATNVGKRLNRRLLYIQINYPKSKVR